MGFLRPDATRVFPVRGPLFKSRRVIPAKAGAVSAGPGNPATGNAGPENQCTGHRLALV